jgi:polysaccharide export outer membrane protein
LLLALIVLFIFDFSLHPTDSLGIEIKNQSHDYRLGPNDVLEITVYREKELDRKVRVSSNGFISLPLIGKIKAEGLTVPELEQRITKKLKRYLKKPQVTVFIKEYSTITVLGEVDKPGAYPLKGEVTVIEAIGLAGGFTEFSAENDVKVIRTENGERKIITVRVADIGEKGDKTQDIILKRGDVVYVPEETITVTGQVQRPGLYPLKGEVTVLQAISLAGGFTKYSARNNVKILRIENGQKKTIRVRVAEISKKGDITKDIILKNGDIVFVPESLF